MLACCFAGCGVSAQTTGGQLDQVKTGMTREQVVGNLGEPAQTHLVNGAPSEDIYICDEQGQIMVMKNRNPEAAAASVAAVPLMFVPFAWLAEMAIMPVAAVVGASRESPSGRCSVNYDQGLVLSTSQTNGIVYTK